MVDVNPMSRKKETLQELSQRMAPFCKEAILGARELMVVLTRSQALALVTAMETSQQEKREEHIMSTVVRPILCMDSPTPEQVTEAEEAMVAHGLLYTDSGFPTALNARWAWFKKQVGR